MHKVIPLILSLLLMIWGWGLTLTANADTSHSATSCNYCSGGTQKYCDCQGYPVYCYDAIEGKTPDMGNKKCAACKVNSAMYWVTMNCDNCYFYSSWVERLGSDRLNSQLHLGGLYLCGDYDCLAQAEEACTDMTKRLNGLYLWGKAHHPYVDSNNKFHYNPCTHGQESSHTYACSSHTSYGTTRHYYCTTHGYVGTSSTCPGLAVAPTPTDITLFYGQSQQITPNQQPSTAEVTYLSSNDSIATVDDQGNVTSVNNGQTTITVTATL